MIRILSENGIDTTTEVDFESMPTHVQRILQGIFIPFSDPLFLSALLPINPWLLLHHLLLNRFLY